MKRVALSRPRRGQGGFFVISVLMGLTMLAVGMVGMTKAMAMQMRAQSRLEMRGMVESIRTDLLTRLSCDQTLPLDLEADCSADKPLVLKDRYGNSITDSLVSKPEDPFFGAGRYGSSYYLKATCDLNRRTLRVELAKGNPEMGFHRHPGTGKPFDFSSPPNPLIGDVHVACGDVFLGGGPSQCPEGEYLAGLDADGAPICRVLPQATAAASPLVSSSCPKGQFAVGIAEDGKVECRKVLSGSCENLGPIGQTVCTVLAAVGL